MSLESELKNQNLREQVENIEGLPIIIDKLRIQNSTKSNTKTFNKNISNFLIAENKLIDIKWEILLENNSSEVTSINQLKIIVYLKYFNSISMSIESVTLVLDEKSFNEFLDEVNKLSKYFN